MKKFIEKLKQLDFGTLMRTVLQILVYVNQIVAVFGNSSFASSPIYQWISIGLTVAVTALTYWFNNDWTSRAMLARDMLDMLKDGKMTEEEAKEFLEKYKNNKGE